MDYNKRKQEGKLETAEMKFLSYTWKDQTRKTIIREELNIFNLNAKIIKSRTQWN
jgi:hypothetical protein